MMIKKYKKKPIIIEALQWTGNISEMEEFCPIAKLVGIIDITLCIPTLEGDHRATEGDYIIKGVKGEFYPCKPDIFHMTYDELSEDKYLDGVAEIANERKRHKIDELAEYHLGKLLKCVVPDPDPDDGGQSRYEMERFRFINTPIINDVKTANAISELINLIINKNKKGNND